MSFYPVKIAEQPDGSYTWTCSIEVNYHRKTMGTGFKACIGIAVFLLLFGAVLARQHRNLETFWIVAGCTAVFLLITLLAFGLTLLATDPQERYEMTETYVKTGSGRSSATFHFRKARAAVFSQKYIELQGRMAKMRIYAPAEDFDFVKDFIRIRLPEECEVRYE